MDKQAKLSTQVRNIKSTEDRDKICKEHPALEAAQTAPARALLLASAEEFEKALHPPSKKRMLWKKHNHRPRKFLHTRGSHRGSHSDILEV